MQAPMIARRLAEKHGPKEALAKARARRNRWYDAFTETQEYRAAARATVWLVVVGYLKRKYGECV